MDSTKDFLGSGWAFPPRLDNRGCIELAHQEDDVAEAILMILKTNKGERPMRPEFGSELFRLQFAPCDAATCGEARRTVREALLRWEPRIILDEVRAAPDRLDTSRLIIEIDYRIRSTNSKRNLVFPFYSIPGEN